MRHITHLVLFLLFALGAPVAAMAQNLGGLSFPVHGNYCGPGHGANGFGWPAPVDPLDYICLQHDLCTGPSGQLSCGCDIRFMQSLRATPWPNPGYKSKARAIYDAMAMMPCTDPAGQAVKMEMAMRDWADGVASGREPPWEIFLRWGYLGLHGFERSMREGPYP